MPAGQVKSYGEMSALLTNEALSEKETNALKQSLGDKLNSVYRVL